jgi:hypothetical protein
LQGAQAPSRHAAGEPNGDEKNPFLVALGDRVRALRAAAA